LGSENFSACGTRNGLGALPGGGVCFLAAGAFSVCGVLELLFSCADAGRLQATAKNDVQIRAIIRFRICLSPFVLKVNCQTCWLRGSECRARLLKPCDSRVADTPVRFSESVLA